MLIPEQISDEVGSQLDLGLLAEPIENGHARERQPSDECGPVVTQGSSVVPGRVRARASTVSA